VPKDKRLFGYFALPVLVGEDSSPPSISKPTARTGNS